MKNKLRWTAAMVLILSVAFCLQACGAGGTGEISGPAVGAPGSGDALQAKAGEIADLDAGFNRIAVLRTDGTVVIVEDYYSEAVYVDYGWRDIVKIDAAGSAMVGLKTDGTVVAGGSNFNGACNVGGWTDIVDIAACAGRTVGLRADGTVVSTDLDDTVGGWTDIVAISTMHSSFGNKIFGVRADGTVVETGSGEDCYTASGWTDIVDVCAGWSNVVGLKSDGTVVISETPEVEKSMGAQDDVTGWMNIREMDGLSEILGLRSDGTVVSIGLNEAGAGDVSDWYDVVDVAAGEYFTVALKRDGSIVGTAETENWNLSMLYG